MAAKFIVIQEDGMPVIRECVRIAKKSLVFSAPVDGKVQVDKTRCYYYNAAYEDYYEDLKVVSEKIIRLRAKWDKILGKLQQVQIKSTRF